MTGHAVGHLRIAACAVVRNGRLLVVRRSPNDPYGPGLWEIPGGVVEAGETYETAARRELREETGLVGGTLRLVRSHVSWSLSRHYLQLHERDYLVVRRSRAPVRLDPAEHSEFRWVDRREASRLPTLPQKRTTFRIAFDAVERSRRRTPPGRRS